MCRLNYEARILFLSIIKKTSWCAASLPLNTRPLSDRDDVPATSARTSGAPRVSNSLKIGRSSSDPGQVRVSSVSSQACCILALLFFQPHHHHHKFRWTISYRAPLALLQRQPQASSHIRASLCPRCLQPSARLPAFTVTLTPGSFCTESLACSLSSLLMLHLRDDQPSLKTSQIVKQPEHHVLEQSV